MRFLYQQTSNPETSEARFNLLSMIASSVVVLADQQEFSAAREDVSRRRAADRVHAYVAACSEERRGLAPGRWMGELFLDDLRRGTDNHRRLMEDTDGLARLVVRPAIWSLWSDYADWPEWYDVVDRIHTMRGLSHGDGAAAVNNVMHLPEFGVQALLAPHLLSTGYRSCDMSSFRFVLSVRAMCEEEAAARMQRVSADRLESAVMEVMA